MRVDRRHQWRCYVLGLAVSGVTAFSIVAYFITAHGGAHGVGGYPVKALDVKASRLSLGDVNALQKYQGIVRDETALSLDLSSTASNDTRLNYNVHIFYYPWYGSPAFDDGRYYHWNHEYLQHWEKRVAKNFPKGRHVPPGDIGASFFPELGEYSSRDPQVIKQHMKWIAESGVGVLAVSWYPSGLADKQGRSWDDVVPILLDSADQFQLKIAFHIEPYEGRTADSVKGDLRYLLGRYGRHRAFYRHSRAHKTLPLVYVYDSYLIANADWRKILLKGAASIRGTELDAFVIGLAVKADDAATLKDNGFDGVYTYFAAQGFSHGSTPEHWPAMAEFAASHRMIFTPAVGPGYDDTQVRPWNYANTKARDDGAYYRRMFSAAISAVRSADDVVTITSFNEWGEGTQVEPAVPRRNPRTGKHYRSYAPNDPSFYLRLTRRMVAEFAAKRDGLVGVSAG